MINLGNLLYRRGYRNAARLTYTEAAKADPRNPIVDVNLGNTFLDGGELEPARRHFERALVKDASLPEAHQGMSYVYARLGDERGANRHRDAGFAPRALTAFPYRGEGTGIRVLLLVSALGGNVGTTEFLDDRIFAVTRVFAEYAGSIPLDGYDLAFNAIGDAERCSAALDAAAKLLAKRTLPLINAPHAVAQTARANAGTAMAGIDDLRTARTATIRRSSLAAKPSKALRHEEFEPPVLLRAPGFHAGMFFERAESYEDVAAIAARLPGEAVSVVQPLDVRSSDGHYRKYRVMFVDGELYPLHLAVGSQWKVHYFSSDMADVAAHREEEERFLRDLEGVLGRRAVNALRAVGSRLGLDYAGADFAVDADRGIALFEANATMIVPSREVRPQLAYRVPYLERVIAAVRKMLLRRAAR